MDASTITIIASGVGAFLGGLISRSRVSEKKIQELVTKAAAAALLEHERACMVRASLRPPAITPAYGLPLEPRR